jgi:hypothetical protein
MPQNRITIIPAIHGKLTMLLTFGYPILESTNA